MAKIDVNGDDADPVFKNLKKEKTGLLGSGIKWNFTKFLVDREGRTVSRHAPTKKPEQPRKEHEESLGETMVESKPARLRNQMTYNPFVPLHVSSSYTINQGQIKQQAKP